MAWLKIFSAAAFLLITATLTTDPAAAAEETCINKLTPCVPYVNDTTNSIPDTCCNPVKETIANESDCLCGYYNTPGMLDSMGIKLSRITDVIRDCQIDGADDPDTICKAIDDSASSPANNLFPEPPPSKNAVAASVAGVGVSSLFLLNFVTALLIEETSNMYM